MNTPHLTNFTDLDDEKKLTILSWRNNPNIRSWMYDDSIIQKGSHLNFIDSLKNNKMKKYFLVSNQEQDLGVIYFTNITTECAEFGIYANPNINNIGKTLMETIINYGFQSLKVKKLKAEVFENNIKAISLYNRFNFKQTDTFIKNNKTILLMERKNENW